MKILVAAVTALACTLAGCAVVPVGPPAGSYYYGPRVVVPAPAVVIRPWYYQRWHGY